jgi:hypothetical protein
MIDLSYLATVAEFVVPLGVLAGVIMAILGI